MGTGYHCWRTIVEREVERRRQSASAQSQSRRTEGEIDEEGRMKEEFGWLPAVRAGVVGGAFKV